MSLTRANAETILVKRCGPLLTAAGMDGSTISGSNADLNDPIGRAIRDLGYTVTSIVAIADADVAQVPEADYDEFLDVAELRTLENVVGNYDDVDLKVGPRDVAYSQTIKQLENKIERLRARLERDYGFGLGLATARVISLGTVTLGDDTEY